MRTQKRHVGSLRGARMSLVRGALGEAALTILCRDCGMDPAIADQAVADVMGNRIRQVRTLRAIYRRAIALGGIDKSLAEKGGSQKDEGKSQKDEGGRPTAGAARYMRDGSSMADGSASPDGSGAGDGQAGEGTDAPLVLLGPGGDFCQRIEAEGEACSVPVRAYPGRPPYGGTTNDDQAAGLRRAMASYAEGLRA